MLMFPGSNCRSNELSKAKNKILQTSSSSEEAGLCCPYIFLYSPSVFKKKSRRLVGKQAQQVSPISENQSCSWKALESI